jgi:hypothetical protein
VIRHRVAIPALLWLCAGVAQAQSPPAATVEASGDAVVFKGRISADAVARFKALLQDSGITRLVITSAGGSVAAALDMADAVHDRQLDIEVPAACLSSCANYIFPAARRKVVGRLGAVAWHGNITHVLYLQQSGQANWSESEIRSARELARREAEFYRRIGVDGYVCWFAKIAPYNVDDFYYLSREDMQRFGIGEVKLRDERPAPDTQALRKVLVDWPSLEAGRPAVKLDE